MPVTGIDAQPLVDALRERGWRCATAESCTGGMVAAAITDVAGSSAVFDYGFVTYANAAKEAMLGVPPMLLAAHGAVSEPVATAMAEGALARSGADVAVAVTGIAGPGGAAPGKPIGTVCLAFAVRGGAGRVVTHYFAGDRAAVRTAATRAALGGVLALCAATAGKT